MLFAVTLIKLIHPWWINVKRKKKLVTLYLKLLYIMHYKSRFNALIMPCNAPYKPCYDLMNNYNHSYNILQNLTIRCYNFRKYNALKYMTNKLSNIVIHFNFGYSYLWKYMMHYNAHYEYLYNALYIKALSKVLPKKIPQTPSSSLELVAVHCGIALFTKDKCIVALVFAKWGLCAKNFPIL